jgi:hypothetical protein
MGDTQIQQPQQTPQPAQPAGGVPATAAAPNDQAAATADTERRKKAFAQLSQSKSWMLALGSLAPPEAGGNTPNLNLKGGDATKLQAAAYKLAIKDAAGAKLAIDYLTAAGADASYATAVRTAADNARTDTEVLTALDAAVALITVSHQDIQTAGLQVLVKLAALTEDGRGYLRADKGAGHADPLDAYIAKNFGGADDASKASKDAYGSLSSAIKAPADAGGKTAAAAQKPEPLTGPEEAQAKQLLTDIKNVFAGVKPLALTADGKAAAAQKANPQQMQRLMTLITAAPPRIKDWVYAWRESDGPNKGKGVLEILGGYLSPSQVEQINDNLDPVERVYKDLFDLRNGARDPKAPKTTEYQIMHDFLAGYSGENGKPVRERFKNDARIMEPFLYFQPADKVKILIRMIVTGREEPDAIDKVHDACDKKDGNAAVQALFELAAKQPADLQKLRSDLIFTHRLKDMCSDPITYNGVKTKPYELFLRLCGVDPNDTKEQGATDKQAEVNPDANNTKPLDPGELGEIEDKLYTPYAATIAKELNGYYCNDDTVLDCLHKHERAAADPHMVDLLRRGKQSPGSTLANRIQAQGIDVRLRIQKKIYAKNMQEVERILGFAADQATVGVIGGQGTLASDNKVENGTGKVPLEQALRETTTESGEPLTEFIHGKAQELATELTRWFGPRADHVRTTWNNYKTGISEKVCADLRTKTGLPRVWPIEMLANAYLPIGGGALETKLKEGLGKDHNDVITEMGMSPTDITARKNLASAGVVEDNKDLSKNDAKLQDATKDAEQAQKVEQFRAPAKELFDGLSNMGRVPGDDKLKGLGAKLTAGLAMDKIAATGPAPVPAAELDVSAKPGGPVHPGEGSPTDFASFYKREFGIDPRRHAVEVAKALANKERTAQQIGDLLGVHDASLYAPPAEQKEDGFTLDEKNLTLVSPGFSLDEASNRAKKIWDLLHDNGQIQLIRQEFGSTQEEDRLINIAFRKLSAGIDIHFYLQQHLSQQKAFGNDSKYALSVGGGGVGDKDTRGLSVVGTEAETEAAVERAQTGKVSIEKQLLTAAKADNMDEVYSLIESATPDQKRQVLANSEVMTALRGFGDDSYEWNRIYKGLTGQADLFDRLESRAHGRHGLIGGTFEGTDEKGMSKDIVAYAKQRKVEIRAEVITTICGGKEPTSAENKKKVDGEVSRRLREEFQSYMENPSIRALLTDELSGAELAKVEGQLNNSGDEDKTASALTEGDWTEDEEKILADIKKMSPAERKRCRENPEYIAQLRKAIQSQGTWRDAMIALDSTEDGSKGDNDDNFAKLEKASRSMRQDTTELMFEQDDVIEALSKLTPDEYARLKANPRLQAQILTSLEGKPDLLAKARQMMGFNAADAGSMTGLTIGDKPDPAKGVYAKAQVERLAFMKFSAENQLTVGAGRGWGVLLQAAIAVYNMKLNPKDCLGEAGSGGGDEGGSTKPLTPDDVKEQAPPAAQPQAAPASGAAATPPVAKAPDPQAAPAAAPTGDAAIEDRLRHDILKDVTGQIQAATSGWGKQTVDDGGNKYGKDVEPLQQQLMIQQAILHQKDPSDALLIQSTGHLGDDEDRIKETLRKASDEKVINEWVTVTQHAPNGSASLKDKYLAYKDAREKAGPADPNQGKRRPKVGSPEWTARTAFKAHVIDTSDVFEDLLIKYTGGLFADDDKTKPGEKRVRDNSEWLEWRTIVRDRIPQLDREKIGTAIGASGDPDAMAMVRDHTLSDTLGQLDYDQERYLVDRGANSNYNMDRLTAGGEGLALDNSMDAYRQTVMQSVISKGPNAGEQYGDIDPAEAARIADAKARFQQNDGAFRDAKAQVATIAATVVALIITAVVTVLTAGTATGPLATILIAAITAGAASAGSNATKKAVQGTDFEFGKEGLENIARDTIMGAVTAGTTWYAGKIVNGLFAASSAAEQAAIIARTAAEPGFFLQMGRQMAENSLQTGMQGLFESGMAAFDPAMWLDGWNEGWRRGSAKARERAGEIPMEMLRAAAIAAMTHSANAGINKLKGGGGEEHDPFAGRDPKSLSLAERSQLVGGSMYKGAKEGVVMGGAEILLDEKTYRSEGGKPADMLGHIAGSSANMAQMSAGSAQSGQKKVSVESGEPGALLEMTEHEAATKKRLEAADKELEAHGSDLSEHEKALYKEVCAQHGGGGGTDTTVMSVAEFKAARAEMVDKAAATYEAEADRKLTAEERVAFNKWVESAPTLQEYIRRAEAGPSGAPNGPPPPPAKAPKFDKPEQCEAERTRAEAVLGKLEASAEAGKASSGVVTELRPQQVESMRDAKKMLDEMQAAAKSPADHAEITDFVSRLNNVSAELGRTLETAGGGASVAEVQKALQEALKAAEAAPKDKALHSALHSLIISGEVSSATTPAEAAAAAKAAPQKLTELKALVDELRNARDNAARREMAAPKDPVAAKETPAPKQEDPAAKEDPKKQDAPAAKEDPKKPEVAKDDPTAPKDTPAKEDPKKDPKVGGVDDTMTADAKARTDLGSQFAGNTLAPDPARAQRGIEAALAGSLPAGAQAHGGIVEMPRGAEKVPLEVQVKIASEAPAGEFAAAATLEVHGPDNAVITVSPSASKEVIERAVAGKLAELESLVRERSGLKRTDTTSALVEGSQATQLSPQDYNQIGQLKTALHQIEAARASGDPAAAESLKRDAYALAVAMGLLEQSPAKDLHKAPGDNPADKRVVGPEAAAHRIELVDGALGPDAAKLRSLLDSARGDTAAIGDIRAQRAAARERLRAWCEEQIAARKEANIRLKAEVDAAIGADGTGMVFDRIIVGGGWAATADFATLGAKGGAGVPGTLSISHGGDPWSGRGDLLMGQNPAELEMRGMAVQPSDLAADPHEFTSSKDFATAVGASGAMAGMPTYDGSVTKIEQRPEGDAHGWPDGANWRITANGKTFYTSKVDVVSGPGPARVPNAGKKITDPGGSGYAIDSHGGKIYQHTPGNAHDGVRNEYHEVDPRSVPPDVLRRLEAERGSVSQVFVDHESGMSVDTSTKPETYRDKDGNVVPASSVSPEVAQRLGVKRPGSGEAPALVDQQGRVSSTRVFDPESNCQIDMQTHKVYRDGAEIDPNTLPADAKARLGINPDGTFRDPRYVAVDGGYSVNPVTGAVIETATGNTVELSHLDDATKQKLQDEMAKRRVGFGGERLADEYKPGADGKQPEVLIFGAGASGAWDVEQAAAGGAKIDWSGRVEIPKPDPKYSPEVNAKLTELRDPATAPARKQELMRELEDVIQQHSFSGGYNRRNTVPGLGAYSPEVLSGVEQNGREIVDVQPTTDGRFFVRFSDGTSHVYDKVTMSIGQDPTAPGGVGQLLQGTALQPNRGGGGEYTGAEDKSGTLRVLGAAGASPAVMGQMPADVKEQAKQEASNLPADSRNIPPAIRNQAGRIASANEEDLGGTGALTADEKLKLKELIAQKGPEDGQRAFGDWKAQRDAEDTRLGAKDDPTKTGEPADTKKPSTNAPEVSNRALATLEGMAPDQRKAHEELFARAENHGQRMLLEKGLAAGHPLLDLERLRYAMSGMSDAEVLKEFSGQGIVQFFQASCLPTSYQIALAEVDPVYAMHLRNNPQEVLEAQKNALVIGGGAQEPRHDLHKAPDALQQHLDDPTTGSTLKDPSTYNTQGDGDGMEPTDLVGSPLHRQLEKATGTKYEVVTNDQYNFANPGASEFEDGKAPHARIGAALDSGKPVIFGFNGHARVITGHEVASDGSITYTILDPWDGTVSKWPAAMLDHTATSSFTIPAEGKAVTPPPTGATPDSGLSTKTAGLGDEDRSTKLGGGKDDVDKDKDAGKTPDKDASTDPDKDAAAVDPTKVTATPETAATTPTAPAPVTVPKAVETEIKKDVFGPIGGDLKTKYQDMPPGTFDRVKVEALEKATQAYRDAIAAGKSATEAATIAKEAGKNAALDRLAIDAVQGAQEAAEKAVVAQSAFKLDTAGKASLADFNAGKRGQLAKKLAPELAPLKYSEMVTLLDAELAKEGGKKPEVETDSSSGLETQRIYEFADGTFVRVKAQGDDRSAGAAMFSIEVRNAGVTGAGTQDDVAFKVDADGRPVPKGPKSIEVPKGYKMPVQVKAFKEAILALGHQVVAT